MTMYSPLYYAIPADTERTARANFPKGHQLMLIADEFGLLYSNPQFAALFSHTGQPAVDPARLALITVFQFMFSLTDEAAVDQAKGHSAWKYALALPLDYAGFDPSVLSEFRDRVIAGGLERLLLDTLLERLQDKKLLRSRGQLRTDSTHVLAAVRTLTRLLLVGETLRHALNALSRAADPWLDALITDEWLDRYETRLSEYDMPKSKQKRLERAEAYGADGQTLLNALADPTTPAALRELAAVHTLGSVWAQQYHPPSADGRVRWREQEDQPPASALIVSPYDPTARLASKGEHSWVGYKAHLTETCDEELPHLIVAVQTTSATADDAASLPVIHEQLAEHKLQPAVHYVDGGYVDSERIVQGEQEQIRVVGPVAAEQSWQARAGQGYAAAAFVVDWAAQQVECPQGQHSSRWHEFTRPGGKPEIRVEFAKQTCAGCAVREQCSKAATTGRTLKLLPQEQHVALQARRAEQHSGEFREEYKRRAGVEGTISQGVRLGGLRQSRYIGEAKTRLQHILMAVAVNLVRLVAWWREEPRATTRSSPFAARARRVLSSRAATAAAACL